MSVAQIASWSPVTTTAFIWAPPESFVDTLPAVLADAPPLPGDLQRAPHFPPTPSTATRLVRVSPVFATTGWARTWREGGVRGERPGSGLSLPHPTGAVRCSRTRRDFRVHGISDNAGSDCSAVVRARTLLQGAIGVGSGVARLDRLPLLPALDRVHDDPGPEADDHDASDHLTDNQHPSRLGHGRNITEPDG